MERKKVLPMKYPPITSYPAHANLLSVILNYEEPLPWFFSHFIQLAYFKALYVNDTRIEFFKPAVWHACPFVKYEKSSRDLVEKKWSSFSDFLINCVDLGQYIFCLIDTFFISSYQSSYQRVHHIHDIFIFGYDIDSQTFDIADFFTDGKYSYSRASFAEIEQGYQSLHFANITEHQKGIDLINYQLLSKEYIFNKSIPAKFIEDYLFSYDTGQRYKTMYPNNNYNKYIVYGMNVYNTLIEYLHSGIDHEIDIIDIRLFQTIYDHKNLMLLRIKYFAEHNYIKSGELLYTLYLQIKKESLYIRNMMIKYNFTKEIKLLYQVISRLHYIIPREYDSLKIMLNEIQSL